MSNQNQEYGSDSVKEKLFWLICLVGVIPALFFFINKLFKPESTIWTSSGNWLSHPLTSIIFLSIFYTGIWLIISSKKPERFLFLLPALITAIIPLFAQERARSVDQQLNELSLQVSDLLARSTSIDTVIRESGLKDETGDIRKLDPYVVVATNENHTSTVPISPEILHEYCGDDEGCQVYIILSGVGHTINRRQSHGPLRVYYYKDSGLWSADGTSRGQVTTYQTDGNGSVNHLMTTHNQCYFTDGEYLNGTSTDNKKGFGLLSWTTVTPQKKCELHIYD